MPSTSTIIAASAIWALVKFMFCRNWNAAGHFSAMPFHAAFFR